ncbi:MAG: hypothetical protein NTU74_01420, partial [Deltaproteobacteria bacterium]|nr:hypothetical protein [Deltaproteobacteria bacterium]
MKKILGFILIAVFCSVSIICNVNAADKKTPKAKIVLKKYSDFKIGILANNFIKTLPLTKDNMKKVMDWASDNGFAWIEIRDPRAEL